MITKENYESRKDELRDAIERSLTIEIANSTLNNTTKEIISEYAAENTQVILVDLVETLAYGRKFFLVCESSPKYYDKGSSYYSLHFVTKDYGVESFFLSNSTMELFGAVKQAKGTHSYWTFPSDAMGMDRNFLAFRKLAKFLAELNIGDLQEIHNAIASKVL